MNSANKKRLIKKMLERSLIERNTAMDVVFHEPRGKRLKRMIKAVQVNLIVEENDQLHFYAEEIKTGNKVEFTHKSVLRVEGQDMDAFQKKLRKKS